MLCSFVQQQRAYSTADHATDVLALSAKRQRSARMRLYSYSILQIPAAHSIPGRSPQAQKDLRATDRRLPIVPAANVRKSSLVTSSSLCCWLSVILSTCFSRDGGGSSLSGGQEAGGSKEYRDDLGANRGSGAAVRNGLPGTQGEGTTPRAIVTVQDRPPMPGCRRLEAVYFHSLSTGCLGELQADHTGGLSTSPDAKEGTSRERCVEKDDGELLRTTGMMEGKKGRTEMLYPADRSACADSAGRLFFGARVSYWLSPFANLYRW